jgi:hypothetical protein
MGEAEIPQVELCGPGIDFRCKRTPRFCFHSLPTILTDLQVFTIVVNKEEENTWLELDSHEFEGRRFKVTKFSNYAPTISWSIVTQIRNICKFTKPT